MPSSTHSGRHKVSERQTVDEARCDREEVWVEEALATGEDRDPRRHLDDAPSSADLDATQVLGGAGEDGAGVGSSIQRNPKGQFLPGNKEWVAGQAERLIKAAEVRRQRLDRTRKLLASLSLEDCEHAATRLRELMDDEDGRVALAAVKLLMDTVTVKDTGESDPEGRGAGGPTFRFVIPMELPVARRRV
jgi:hypothetical protein